MTTPVFAAPERLDIAARTGDPRLPLDPTVAQRLSARLSAREIERAEPDIDYLGIMSDPKSRTSPAIFDAAVGSLGVLGYGRPWLARALHLPEAALRPGQRRIIPYRMRLVLTAAIRIGSRWATPESTGQTLRQIDQVRTEALARGARVPAAYGNRYEMEAAAMVLPSPTDPPRIRRNDPEGVAAAKINVLAYFCQHGGTEDDLARRFGMSTRTVGRARQQVGLRHFRADNCSYACPGQDDLIAEIARAYNALAVEGSEQAWRRLVAFAADRNQRLAAAEQAPTDASAAA